MQLDWCTNSPGLEALKNIKCPSNQTIFEKKKKEKHNRTSSITLFSMKRDIGTCKK
jgi:hypothetical protein